MGIILELYTTQLLTTAYLFPLGFGPDSRSVAIRSVHVVVDLLRERRDGCALGHVIVGFLKGRGRRFFPDGRREYHGRSGRRLSYMRPATLIASLDVLLEYLQHALIGLRGTLLLLLRRLR